MRLRFLDMNKTQQANANERWQKEAEERARTGVDNRLASLAAALDVSRTTLYRYLLPKKHPRHRQMPKEVRDVYERIVTRQRNRQYARKLDPSCVEMARTKARKP
jgi:hypothetical protein